MDFESTTFDLDILEFERIGPEAFEIPIDGTIKEQPVFDPQTADNIFSEFLSNQDLMLLPVKHEAQDSPTRFCEESSPYPADSPQSSGYSPQQCVPSSPNWNSSPNQSSDSPSSPESTIRKHYVAVPEQKAPFSGLSLVTPLSTELYPVSNKRPAQVKEEGTETGPHLMEERELKRQRRLIKNRESAQLSRQRKKMYIDELEKKNKDLMTHNEKLAKENTLLREENASLRKKLASGPGFQTSFGKTTTLSKNGQTVCVLAILFAFVIYSSFVPITPISSPLSTQLTPFSTRRLSSLSNSDGDNVLTQTSPTSISPTTAIQAYQTETKPIAHEQPRELLRRSDETFLEQQKPSSYVYCSEAHQFISNEKAYVFSDEQPTIFSFLLPPTSLNVTLYSTEEANAKKEGDENKDFLYEIVCEVQDISRAFPKSPKLNAITTSTRRSRVAVS